jgi:hypothetical protein
LKEEGLLKKPHNNGEWTEARFNGFIKSLLRGGSMKWGPRNQCIKEARVRRGWYLCDGCGQEVPATLPPKKGNKRRIKNIVADHIHPVIDPAVGFETWDEVIKRMFCERDGFQALCHHCHSIKTQEEKEVAKQRKANVK